MARSSEERTPWWNQDVKEAIQTKKDALKALLLNKSSSDLQFQQSKMQKAAALAAKLSKKLSWEEFGCRLDSNYSSANIVFGPTIPDCVGKALVSQPPSTIQLETSSRMKRKSFYIKEYTLKIC